MVGSRWSPPQSDRRARGDRTAIVPAGRVGRPNGNTRTSAALLLTPPASAAIAAVGLNERLAPVEIIGAVLVLAGIAGAGGALEFILGGRNRHRIATESEAASHARVV
jgi:hypothetical protein